jgi:hypothetical protein
LQAFNANILVACLFLPSFVWAVENTMILGLESACVHEVGTSGQTLNKETGQLPVIGFDARLPLINDWHLISENRLVHGGLSYDGMLQNGNPYQTTTGTRFIDIQLGVLSSPVGNLLSGEQRLVGKLGSHEWKRNIEGSGGVNTLDELYQWHSLSVGLWHNEHHSKFNIGIDVFQSFNGSMNIDVPNIGQSRLSLPNGQGFNLKAAYRLTDDVNNPIAIGLMHAYHWTHRSNSFSLTHNGNVVGNVTEPDHNLQRTSVYLSVGF